MKILRIHLLGHFLLQGDGGPLPPIHAVRVQALLAYLVLHAAGPQSRHHLAALFWPESSESQAHTNLRNLVHLLRRALPDPACYLLVDATTVRWNPAAPCVVDVAEFEAAVARAAGADAAGDTAAARDALEQAVAAYGGDLLPGCYDDWILARREELRERFLDALARLVRLAERAQDYPAAIAYARRLLRDDPLHEATYRDLMRLFAAQGDRAGVMRTYQACLAVLREELGVEPAEATTREYERLLAAAQPGPPDAPPSNLPAQTTGFVGRERVLAEVTRQLRRPEVRLVTLSGMAGTGKTRLALQVAAGCAAAFPGGVCFVDLAPVTDPALVVPAIARALGVREVRGAPGTLEDHVQDFLRARQALLVVDNFEQVLPAAPVLAGLLAACPGLKILVTSRALLHLRGEKDFPLPPLDLPESGAGGAPADLAQCESVALFVERARDARPAFALTRDNAAAVAAICRRLDGLPLAIELAAARVRLLAPQALLARLDKRLELLTGGAGDLPPRQQTLRNAIAWSYGLLPDPARPLFRRLGVFPGGFTLDAAESIGPHAGGAAVLDSLTVLLDNSLLWRREAAAGQVRFGMLETVREYALERLAAGTETAAIRARHAQIYLDLAVTAEAGLVGPEQQAWIGRLDAEHDNLRAALAWLLDADPPAALRLATALGLFWRLRGHWTEGLQWLEQLLAAAPTDPAYPWALHWAGALAAVLGNEEQAARRFTPALELFRTRGDHRGEARVLSNQGRLALNRGEGEGAADCFRAGLALCRAHGDTLGIADMLTGLGESALQGGDYAAAREYFEQALAIHRSLGDPGGTAHVLQYLGWVLLRLGRYDEALASAEESLRTGQELGDRAGMLAARNTLAMIAQEQGDLGRAVALLEANLAADREIGAQRAIAADLNNLGYVRLYSGDYARARAHLHEAVALLRHLQHTAILASPLINLGAAALHEANPAEARGFLGEALEIAVALDAQQYLAECLAGLAGVAAYGADPARAACLFGAAEALREGIGDTLRSFELPHYERLVARAGAGTAPAAFAAAWATGRALSLEEAIALARQI